jgi:hypothetical protein
MCTYCAGVRANPAAAQVGVESVERQRHGAREVAHVAAAALPVALRVQGLLERLEVPHPLHGVTVIHYISLKGHHKNSQYKLRISNKYGSLTRNKFLTKSVTTLK